MHTHVPKHTHQMQCHTTCNKPPSTPSTPHNLPHVTHQGCQKSPFRSARLCGRCSGRLPSARWPTQVTTLCMASSGGRAMIAHFETASSCCCSPHRWQIACRSVQGWQAHHALSRPRLVLAAFITFMACMHQKNLLSSPQQATQTQLTWTQGHIYHTTPIEAKQPVRRHWGSHPTLEHGPPNAVTNSHRRPAHISCSTLQ
jgi:hypothetical protein